MRKTITDHFAIKAKQEGYLARSVYKLKEIDEKTGLIRPGMRVLDIGAAPGSWTQYCLTKLGPRGFIVSIDVHTLKIPIPEEKGKVFTADFFTEIDQLSLLGPYDAVISDAAPATTGNRTVDTGKSFSLVHDIICQLPKLIARNGNVVCKLFQGGDEQEIIGLLKTTCKTARIMKPKASRSESFEIFVVGTGWK